MHPGDKILRSYKKGKLTHFKCKNCHGGWSSFYHYVKCPGCKSEDIERR